MNDARTWAAGLYALLVAVACLFVVGAPDALTACGAMIAAVAAMLVFGAEK